MWKYFWNYMLAIFKVLGAGIGGVAIAAVFILLCFSFPWLVFIFVPLAIVIISYLLAKSEYEISKELDAFNQKVLKDKAAREAQYKADIEN